MVLAPVPMLHCYDALINPPCSQVVGSIHFSLSLEQRLTRSLLSGSAASVPGDTESAGGSYAPSRFSRPYVMCSATDAASAAIDFKKGSVDEGVVDSPPSRGPAITPVCSPSPLKRSWPSSVARGSLSPTARVESTPNRKLYDGMEDSYADPRLKDQVCSPIRRRKRMVQNNGLRMTSRGSARVARSGSPNASQISRPINIWDSPSRTSRGDGTTYFRHGSPRPILRGDRQALDSPSIGSGRRDVAYATVVRQTQSGSPTRSLCSNDMRVQALQYQTKGTASPWTWSGTRVFSSSASARPSRREDILKGLAKLKEKEAALFQP